MIYELINPSDKTTFEAPDDTVARAVALVLGKGAYGLRDENGRSDIIPFFLFGGFDAWASREGFDLDALLSGPRRAEVADALSSCAYVSISGRDSIFSLIGIDSEALSKWNDAHRSSMNNICGRAASIAAVLRKDREAS